MGLAALGSRSQDPCSKGGHSVHWYRHVSASLIINLKSVTQIAWIGLLSGETAQ